MAYVLVVEDEILLRSWLAERLRDEGHDVVEAASGDEAKAVLSSPIALSIDVVVTDLELPGSCDGVALTRHINARFPALPVIVASGRPPPTWDGLTIAGFYQKPYDPDAISRRVAALCGDGTDTAQRDQGRG
ncbi:MAG TPA: response regulator [Acetobacteraceae bacterium]|jgi:DNA-binding NtrC family response regulator|nr:response regulator [Acetobacteraceae bacterium]